MASRDGWVHFSAISHSAAAMKSSNTFCFCSFIPAWCQASPYSPPPRMLAVASTPPRSIHPSQAGTNLGTSGMSKPP